MEVLVPDEPPLTRIENAWLRFVRNLRDVLVVQSDDRPLDQYLTFRDETLALVESAEFLAELRAAWFDATGGDSPKAYPPQAAQRKIVNLVILELESSAREAEIAKQLFTNEPEQREASLRKAVGRGSTVTGSVKDIFEDFMKKNPLLKGGITVFRELLDLFK
jgi:hypothetical protein